MSGQKTSSLQEHEQAQGHLGSEGHELAPKVGEVFLDFCALFVLLIEHAAQNLVSVSHNGQSAPRYDTWLAAFLFSADASRLRERAMGKTG